MEKNQKFINKKVNSSKTNYVLVENKINELLEKVELISTTGLKKN